MDLTDDGRGYSLSEAARRREVGFASPQAAQRAMHFNTTTAKRLSVEAILRGHHGCVNRLAWNESGSLLASGSDDRKVLLWSYPDTQRQPISIATEHQANIFGVRFLPQTGDARLVSGAMDYTVQLHQLDTRPADMKLPLRGASTSRRNPNTAATPASVRTVVYACHRSRVKDVAVEPLNPHLFWSASEDGTVRQFDVRLPTAQQRDFESPNMLLAVTNKGRYSELKSLNLNPAAPHQLAVAAADPLLRVFDRRMLIMGAPRGRQPGAPPVLALAPPHLAMSAAGGAGRGARLHATYVAFSNRGDKLVGTYHGSHAYSFDVTGAAPGSSTGASSSAAQPPVQLFAAPPAAALLASPRSKRRLLNGSSSSSGMGNLPGMLPAAAERAKADGNLHLFSKQYYEAVQKYNEAIRLAPSVPVLYTNRALALLNRAWEGDAVWALRDAEIAVALDPAYMKAHYRRVQALRAAGLLQSAATAADLFRRQFPENAADAEGLEEQIAADTQRQSQQAELRRQQAEQRRQVRRRRGLQFDRQQRLRRHDRAVAAAAAPAGEPAAGSLQSSAAAAGPSEGQPSAEAGAGHAAVGEPAREADTAAAAESEAPQASTESWDDPYASASSGEGEEEDDSAAAATHAAASSGIDAHYAAALCAAAEEGGSAEGAAAAPGAPSYDAIAAAMQQQGHGKGEEAGGVAAVGSRRLAEPQPSLWHAYEGGRRMLQRYVGHCNLQTDIKEACFLGADDALVAAGSDDGRVLIYDAATGDCVRMLSADEDVANALQPHPHLPVLATSGIEPTVKLWSPDGEPTSGGDIADAIRRNQERLKEGPTVLRGVDPRIIAALTDNPELLRALMQRATRRPPGGGAGGEEGDEGDEEADDEVQEVSCRVA